MSSLRRYDLRLPASVGSRKQNIIYYHLHIYYIFQSGILFVGKKSWKKYFVSSSSFFFFIGKGYKKR